MIEGSNGQQCVIKNELGIQPMGQTFITSIEVVVHIYNNALYL